MTFWKRQNYRDSKKISDCQELGGKESSTGRTQKIFKAMKRFSLMLQWQIHVIILFSKPMECTRSRRKPNVNCGLWVITMCQFNHNEYTTLVQDVDNGGGYACIRARYIWEISLPSTQFCCESKTAQKNLLKKKKKKEGK